MGNHIRRIKYLTILVFCAAVSSAVQASSIGASLWSVFGFAPSAPWATYWGESPGTWGYDIAVSHNGRVVLVGSTASGLFPLQNAIDSTIDWGPECFAAGFEPHSNSVIFSTYIGGNGEDFPVDVELFSDGSILIAIKTTSTNLLTNNALFDTIQGGSDVYLLRLSASGDSVEAATYFGGAGSDSPYDVYVDTNDRVCLVGHTESSDFPLTPSLSIDSTPGAFATILDGTLQSIVYSTTLGNTTTRGTNGALIGDTLLVGGDTRDGQFPTTNNAYDKVLNHVEMFLTYIEVSTGNILYSTLLGGDSADYLLEFAIDREGHIGIAGRTLSPNFPTTPSPDTTFENSNDESLEDFVMKFHKDSSNLLFSRFIGGTGGEYVEDLAIDSLSRIIVVGSSFPGGMPVTSNALPIESDQEGSGFLHLFAPNGAVALSTYIAGEGAGEGRGVEVRADTIYTSGYTASTSLLGDTQLDGSLSSNGGDAFIQTLILQCIDQDGDGIGDLQSGDCGQDNCVSVFNPSQSDSDWDGVGDACDECLGFDDMADGDADGVADSCDNCPALPNLDQSDSDSDSVGDPCDKCNGFNDNLDADGDSVPDGCDICPGFDDLDDLDGDTVPDGCDSCPNNPAALCCCLVAGDTDNDGSLNIADVTSGIAYIFSGGPQPACQDQADADGDNSFNIADVSYTIGYIFSGGPAPVCGTTGL